MEFGKAAGIQSDPINSITRGFDLGTAQGALGFAAHSAGQGLINAGATAAIQGGSFQDHLIGNLESQGNNVLSALAFNQVGSLADSWMTADAGAGDVFGVNFWREGGLGRTGLHAVAGGTVTQITDGNFGAGAVAAGGNQLAAGFLTDTVGAAYDPVTEQGQYNNWRTTGSQLAGLAAAAAANDDVNQGTWIAKQADTYNRQLHPDEIAFAMDDERVAKFQEALGLTEEQARIELMRSGAAAMDEGWAQVLAGDETNTARAREFLAAELQEAGRADLFKVTRYEFGDQRIGLKDLFADQTSLDYVSDYAAIKRDFNDTATLQKIDAARREGTADGIPAFIKGAAQAGALFTGEATYAIAHPGEALDRWADIAEDLSYTGVELRLQLLQGQHESVEYDLNNTATEVGLAAGLGAARVPGLLGHGPTRRFPGESAVGDIPIVKNTPLAKVDAVADKPSFSVSNKQLGRKLAKHVKDFGGDPSSVSDRKYVKDIINDIATNPEKTINGSFAGQGKNGERGMVQFRIKGNDVVVTTPDGQFVTILKEGVTNPSVKSALDSE